MHREVNFTKCTLAKYPANPVELTSCWRSLIKLFEMKSKHFDKFLQVSVKLKLFFVTTSIKLCQISNLRNYRRFERLLAFGQWSQGDI